MSDFEHAIQEAQKLARTPEGKQLVRQLQQLGGSDLRQAMDAAAAGETEAAKQLLSQLMQNPQTQRILEMLGGSYGK